MAYNVMHIDIVGFFFIRVVGPKSTGRSVCVFVFFVALFPRSLEENLRKTKSPGSKAAQLELDLWVAAASLNLTHVPHKLCLPTHTHTCTHTHTPKHTHTHTGRLVHI